jgi:hypothetical protein
MFELTSPASQRADKIPVTTIILMQNEEINIERRLRCLGSGLIQIQKAMIAAGTTALAKSLVL